MKKREMVYGSNRKPKIIQRPYWRMLLDALSDFTLRILIIASIVSIVIEVATAEQDHRSTA